MSEALCNNVIISPPGSPKVKPLHAAHSCHPVQPQQDGDVDDRPAKTWIDRHDDTWDPHVLPAVCQGRCPAHGEPTDVRLQLPGSGWCWRCCGGKGHRCVSLGHERGGRSGGERRQLQSWRIPALRGSQMLFLCFNKSLIVLCKLLWWICGFEIYILTFWEIGNDQ